ncbi:MAG: hypothetical protein QMD36_03395 [Candidatus Aenigmarchaeota archaeon]|nr:hypothetical protein [Candidatus Aenigmarchaeota archaeon]
MKMLFAVFIVVSLLMIQSTLALTAYLRPPKMTIRLNTSDTIERSLEIKNFNNITIGIGTRIVGNLSEVVRIEESSFYLEPNETRTLDFKTKANDPGVYVGEIQVTYSANSGLPVTLPAEIIVVATEKSTQNYNNIFILIVTLIVVVAAIIFMKRGR